MMDGHGRTVDDYTYYSHRVGGTYYGSRRERELKLFSHRFHFSPPSTMTLTVTHKDGWIVLYAMKNSVYI